MSQTGPFKMLGDAAAAACEGDSCLLPGAVVSVEPLDGVAEIEADVIDVDSVDIDSVDIEPSPAEAAAASARAVTAALDEGASL
ncbi:hypothetical protein [Frondihabitans peucedani]|uniref:hypothetical protein n=1 Tax=Frondihabitans peucedani TaxID=598626 RepID=UPI0031E466F7